MITRFALAPTTYATGFFNQLIQQLTRYFSSAVSKDEAVNQIILQSSGGFNYAVTVDDSGVLHTTSV